MKKVFVWGTFDILHKGHIAFLKDAKKYGTDLYVVIVPDEIVYENKKRKPVNNEQRRADNLKFLGFIDGIFIDSLSLGLESVIKLKPDVFVFGYDQNTEQEENLKKFLKDGGLEIEYHQSVCFADGVHSSKIRED